jgi:uncharacterized protein
MKRNSLKLIVKDLDAPVELEGSIRAAEVDLEPPEATLDIRARVTRCGGEVLVKGTVRASLKRECALCLGPADLKINESFTSSRPLAEAAEIDVLPDIRDAFVAGFPMQLKCSPECKGLCPGCGRNLNKDSCRCSGREKGASLKAVLDEALTPRKLSRRPPPHLSPRDEA